ncbi:MAG: hypothetical protein M1834_003593 [Cirrosporium novae-zelandiae]|nr:MAG: hypothetical protein M1834_003593 [Cirrosporium novae-zelandiae]
MDQTMELLRSTLQPITHNLPLPIRDALVQLLSAPCYKTLLLDIDLINPASVPCIKLAISKALGIGIIGASSVVKIPQLLKLLSSSSSQGISFASYLLETTSYLITLAYSARSGFPFSTYGETALIAVQDVVIACLVLVYGGKGIAATSAFVAGLAGAVYAIFNEGVVDMGMLSYLQAGAGLLGVASKAPQIWTVWRQGGTGQLSAFAIFNYLLGSLARVFTTLQEVDDVLILYGYLAGFALNAILAFQMLYYWNSGSAKTKTKAKRGKNEKGKVAVGGAGGGGSGSGSGGSPKQRGPSTRRRG